MNILELCLSPGYGGLEMYPHKILRQLSARGVSCRAVVSKGTLLAERLQADGIEHTFLATRFKLAPFMAARRLARLIDGWGIDILHMHWGDDLNLAVLAKRRANRPVKLIYTRQMALTRDKHDLYHRFLYRHIDRYVVITRLLKEDATRYLPMPKENIEHLYYGVAEPIRLSTVECEKFLVTLNIDPACSVIGVFSRIQHVKGQHLAIEALRRLVDNGVDAHLLLVGHIMDQPYYDEQMRTAAAVGIKDRVHYAGFVDNPASLMGCCDVVVLPSYGETFGLVTAEAMRAGVAVVGSNSGGVPEMIRDGETGLLFTEGDAQYLADALQRILTDTALRDRVAMEGKLFADKEFDEALHYDRLVDIFSRSLV